MHHGQDGSRGTGCADLQRDWFPGGARRDFPGCPARARGEAQPRGEGQAQPFPAFPGDQPGGAVPASPSLHPMRRALKVTRGCRCMTGEGATSVVRARTKGLTDIYIFPLQLQALTPLFFPAGASHQREKGVLSPPQPATGKKPPQQSQRPGSKPLCSLRVPISQWLSLHVFTFPERTRRQAPWPAADAPQVRSPPPPGLQPPFLPRPRSPLTSVNVLNGPRSGISPNPEGRCAYGEGHLLPYPRQSSAGP